MIFILSLHLSGFADENQKSWLMETLELFQKKFIFSTTYIEEVENNKILFSEVDAIVDHVLKHYPHDLELLIPCIRLLYIQGNHHLYNDRSVLAQKKLLLAKQLCEQDLGDLHDTPPKKLCQHLAAIDKRLPSMYAMILHILGKSYIYPWDQQNKLQWEKGKSLLIKAIQMRDYIDAYPELFEDKIDSNPVVGNTHIFKRIMGFVYLQEGLLNEAENVYVEMMKVNDDQNHRYCLKNLIRIYQKQGQLAKTLPERRWLYQKATESALRVLKLIELDEGLNRVSLFYTLIGDLYLDPLNPFRDIELAHRFFETGKRLCTPELKSLSLLVHQGLSRTHSELSNLEHQKAKTDEWDYSQSACVDFLKEINDQLERSAIAYEELGDIYREKKEYFLATALYSNAASLLNGQFPVLQKRLIDKMEQVEKDFFPRLQSSEQDYSSLLAGYKSKLESIRSETVLMIDIRPVEEIYAFVSERYRDIVKTMLFDLMSQTQKPETDFALICGGSTGWNVATPYSDLELAFLIEEDSDEAKDHFRSLSDLLTLRSIALGETPIASLRAPFMSWLTVEASPSIRGFMLDPPLLFLNKLLVGTPKEIALLLQSKKSSSMPNLQLTFLNYGFVAGNPALTDKFEAELSHTFNENERGSVAKELLERDLTRWDLKGYFDESGQRSSIKHDLYRSFDTILYDISFKYWVRGAKSPWELIKKLQKNGLLSPAMAEKALKTFDEIGRLRLKAYTQAKQQREWLITSQNGASCLAYPVDESMLLEIYYFLAAFQEHAKTLEPFCEQLERGISNAGIIDLAFLKFDLAEEEFKSALKKDPANRQALKNLGILLLTLERTLEAKDVFERLLIRADSILAFAEANHYLGITSFHLNEPQEAYSHLEKSLDFYKIILANEDPILSDVYIDLGLVLIEMKKCKEGIECILKRVEMDTRFYGKVHPIVSRNYYRLGCALSKSGNYHEARHYLEKAIYNDAIMYGSRHVRLANYYRELGVALLHVSDPINAIKYFTMAQEIDTHFFGDKHPLTRHDQALLTYANDLPLLDQDMTKIIPHHNSMECDLAKAYQQHHPVYKAQKFHKLGVHALFQGNEEQAVSYFEFSQLIAASYFKKNLI